MGLGLSRAYVGSSDKVGLCVGSDTLVLFGGQGYVGLMWWAVIRWAYVGGSDKLGLFDRQ